MHPSFGPSTDDLKDISVRALAEVGLLVRHGTALLGPYPKERLVATEVKALAAQTARATCEISGQIAQVQTSTGQAVLAIDGITGRTEEISAVATSIAVLVEEQGAATQEIVRNVSQAAQGAEEVTSNISGVAGVAEETGAAASQVLGAASELSRQAEILTVEVGCFLATMRAA